MDSAWYCGRNGRGCGGRRPAPGSPQPRGARGPGANLVRAVREVEPRDVHPGADHLLEALHGARRRPCNPGARSALRQPELSRGPPAPGDAPAAEALLPGLVPNAAPARGSGTVSPATPPPASLGLGGAPATSPLRVGVTAASGGVRQGTRPRRGRLESGAVGPTGLILTESGVLPIPGSAPRAAVSCGTEGQLAKLCGPRKARPPARGLRFSHCLQPSVS